MRQVLGSVFFSEVCYLTANYYHPLVKTVENLLQTAKNSFISESILAYLQKEHGMPCTWHILGIQNFHAYKDI